ncbi:MAG: zinc-dependent metalloprotease [Actinomycetota bacterium]|jgi:putative hydrolase|nr:zinc-dependent metalloprotease [Actinomycetota bacterium]MDA3028392.1 zinc-dependent metalloprotease [Actinomycetota bacterium]
MAEPPDDPFGGLPFLGDLARAMSGQGPISWEAAQQFAQLGATGGTTEANVDPASRIAIDRLAGIARMHLTDLTGIDLDESAPSVVTPGRWAADTLEAYRPLFTDLATALSRHAEADEGAGDPMAQMMAGLSRMMAPAMLGMAVGSMVGDLARRAFGVHDLPIPRQSPTLSLVPSTIDAFANEWEIGADEMRMWVLAHEYAGWIVGSATGLSSTLSGLIRRHVGAFRPDPDAIAERLGSLDMSGDDPMEALQRTLGDPEVLLGAIRSPEQRELAPALDAVVAAVVGLTDWLVDAVSVRVVGGEALRIAEAVRRRRVESSSADVFVERLLGVRIDDAQVREGKAFVQGVVDRIGEDRAISTLLTHHDAAPTANEITAPGLWLARLGIE